MKVLSFQQLFMELELFKHGFRNEMLSCLLDATGTKPVTMQPERVAN